MLQKFKIDRDGVKQLLLSDGVQADLTRRAYQIAGTAGEGWEVETGPSAKGDRASARVSTTDPKVRAINNRDHTLMRALDAGRN